MIVDNETALRFAQFDIALLEGALAGTRFARAELEQEVARLRNEIGVCDKHETINHVMDAWCPQCYEEWAITKGYK